MVMTDDYDDDDVFYVTEETKLWLSPSVKQCQNPCSGPPPVYKDLSARHDWPVKKAIVDFANQVEWKSKRTSDNLLSPLVIQKRGRLMIMITS